MTIKVANVIEEGRIGGPHLRIIEVARRIGEVGCNTTVIHPVRDSEGFSARLADAGVLSKPIKLSRMQRGWRNFFQYCVTFIPDVLRLRRAFLEEQFDVVHCSGGAWQVKGVIAAKLSGTPAIWHLNDTSIPVVVRKSFGVLANWAASGFIVAGRRVYEYYRLGRWPEKPVWEIQAPVDTAVFDPATVDPDAEVERLQGQKALTVANVNYGKGLHVLIEAASLLGDRFPGLSFVVIGPVYESQKPYFTSILDRARKLGVAHRVHFLGPKKNVPAALAAADICVCPSLFEASPMAVWEAMAMARPVVSTDVGDVARFIVDGQSGVVVAPASAQELADGIARYLDDSALRSACAGSARRVALDNFDIRVCVEKHAQCYREALRSSRQSVQQETVKDVKS